MHGKAAALDMRLKSDIRKKAVRGVSGFFFYRKFHRNSLFLYITAVVCRIITYCVDTTLLQVV